jgi:two-component system NtrC family response regulator
MAEGNRITPEDLELYASPGKLEGKTLKEAREEMEHEMVQRALRKHKGRISQAALELGISRPTLYELMEKLGINRGEKTE